MYSKALAGLVLIPLVLSGCASEPEVSPSESANSDLIQIVSSTNVWGGIAEEIGGEFVSVRVIIDSANQDPHSYEASARDQLAVSKADLVIANGGGYDSFMDQLAKTAEKEVFYAVETDNQTVEEDHSHSNEHIWYDFNKVDDFATRLAAELSNLSPNHKSVFETNLGSFESNLQSLLEEANGISQLVNQDEFISTEPISDYLLESIGLVSSTPEAFSDAIEEERDLAPEDLLEVENLILSKSIDLLVVSQQTASAQVLALSDLAERNSILVVEMSELRPAELSYFDWMMDNLERLAKALN